MDAGYYQSSDGNCRKIVRLASYVDTLTKQLESNVELAFIMPVVKQTIRNVSLYVNNHKEFVRYSTI